VVLLVVELNAFSKGFLYGFLCFVGVLFFWLFFFSNSIECLNLQKNSFSVVPSVYSDLNNVSFFVENNKIVIVFPEGSVLNYGFTVDSNSMLPGLSSRNIVFFKKPVSENELSVGNIIAYDNNCVHDFVLRYCVNCNYPSVLHKIVFIGFDDSGWFALTKGDNNLVVDKCKVRFKDVYWKVVGLI